MILFHFRPISVSTDNGLPHAATVVLTTLLASGSAGVDFFFVLSGFILSYTYLTAEGALRGGLRGFWIARVARIYPVYLLAMTFAIAPFLLVSHSPPVSPLCQALPGPASAAVRAAMLQAWLPCAQVGWNGPSWTLSAEAFFYLCFPFLAVHLHRLSRGWLLAVGLLCWVALFEAALATDLAAPRGGYPAASPWLLWVYTNPLVHLPEFILGVIMGVLFLRRRGPISLAYAGYCVAAALLALSALIWAGQGSAHWFDVAALPFFALLIWAAAHGQGPISAFFGSRPLILLGESSYALYLLHLPIHQMMTLKPVMAVLAAWGLDGRAVFFCLYLAVALGVSIAVYRGFETPARRAIRAYFAPRKGEAALPRPVMGLDDAARALPRTAAPGSTAR